MPVGQLKVLHVIDTLGMGGAESWLMEILRLWSRTGAASMDFVATSGERGLFDDEARELGARIHYLRYSRRNMHRFAPGFRDILRRGSYSAIHDHQDYASGWHFLLGGGALPEIRVTHVHNPAYQIRAHYGTTPLRRFTARIGKRLIARYATRITGTSRQVLDEYGFDDKIFSHIPRRALHCGIDTARFAVDRDSSRAGICRELGWPSDSLIVLFAGRIDRSPDPADPQAHKNSAIAVSVATELALRENRAHVMFAGRQSAAVSIFQRRLADAGLGDRIRFLGIRQDINQLMAASDALLFPSRGEGLGMVAVEAQAAGLPVLASSAVPRECVVVPELVRFRNVADGPEQWANDLLELAQTRPNRQRANRMVAESPFALARSSDALLKLYSGD